MISATEIGISQVKIFVRQFQDYLLYERRLADNTATAYLSDLDQMLVFWESLETSDSKLFLQEVTKKFLLSLFYNKNLDTQSVSRKVSSLRCFKKYLARQGYNLEIVTKNPRVKRKLPIVAEAKDLAFLLDTLTNEELESKYPLRDKAILELLYATGVRCNELVNIHIEHIAFPERFIKICKGKGGKERIVLYGAKAATKLAAYLEIERRLLCQTSSPYLFLNSLGSRLSPRAVQRILENFRRYLPECKSLTPHTLRHSFATHMLTAGAGLRTVQELLGHSSLLTTELYTQISQVEMASFLEKNHPIQTFARKNKDNCK